MAKFQMMKADYAFGLAIALMIGCSLYFGPHIKGAVAMQWGLDGKPTWYAPRVAGLWGMVAFAFAVRLLIWARVTFVPEKVRNAETGLLIASIVLLGCHFYVLFEAANLGP